jgi:hypothetical protein
MLRVALLVSLRGPAAKDGTAAASMEAAATPIANFLIFISFRADHLNNRLGAGEFRK